MVRPIRFRVYYDDGVTQREYVPRTLPELRSELSRIHQAIYEATRMLSTMGRVKHVVIKTALLQLRNARRTVPDDAPAEELAGEIARLSVLMEDTLFILNKLKHCRVHHMEEARFKLLYGQTPKKRELPTTYGKGGKVEKEDYGKSNAEGEWAKA